MKNLMIAGYRFVKTCEAWPEQYEVFDYKNTQVGYLRLRNGYFQVNYPDCLDEIIYEAHPAGDSEFMDCERDFYLNEAAKAIDKRIAKNEGR